MNGNRGAKGSIKDRLISLLYRLRYKKKALKEENYTISNKQKQEKYLYQLKDFKEREDINILDNEDKNKLDKINYKVNFKVQKKKKKGIDIVDLKLESIESKSSELSVPVNLKKEIKKTNQEVVILKEVDTFIKKSIQNINEIQKELDSIKKESKDKNKDTEELEERYIKLKQKVDKLKQQYDTIKDRYDLSEFSIIESIKLIDSIDDYKTLASLNEMEMLLKVCKKEISKIDNIVVITEENKKVGNELEETKEKQTKIKIKFEKSKEKANKINSLEEDILNELKYQEKIINEMYKKASYFEKEVNTALVVIEKRNVLGSLFRIAGGILTLPFTGRELFGVALGSTLINRGLKEMNRKLKTEERLVVNYKYEDISKQIEDVKDKLEYTNLMVNDSLNEIKKLKVNFKNEYKQYNGVLPEYESALKLIDNLESKLLEHQEKLLNMDNKLETEKEINKQKMKKLGK